MFDLFGFAAIISLIFDLIAYILVGAAYVVCFFARIFVAILFFWVPK